VFRRLLLFSLTLLIGASRGAVPVAQVLTSQYDNARLGATLVERILTPANVDARQFGKLFTLTVDGDVYAQPLYVPRVEIPGKGVHNVLYVATEHDTVYAFDADRPSADPLWLTSFLTSSRVSAVPAGDTNCPFISPEIGITPTPVIDYATGTLFVLARTKERLGWLTGSRYVQRLHALAVTTGAEKLGGPVEIQASIEGTGAGAVSGRLAFDPLRQLPRAGLLLAHGQVYVTWASSCDVKPYHGWVMAYDAMTLSQTAVFNTSPNSNEAGVWQSDMGPAADDTGLYVATGNGTFDPSIRAYGDSLLQLRLEGKALALGGVYTPPNEAQLNASDLDLGSGGPLLLPGTARPRLLVIGGKDGRLLLIDRDRGLELQNIKLGGGIYALGGGIYAAPAYWNGHVFVLASNDRLRVFAVSGGRLSTVGLGAQRLGNPGASPIVSANGTKDGVVWLLETKAWNDVTGTRPAILHAFDAANIERELYNSEQKSARDGGGSSLRFTVPMIAGGRVYVGAKRQVIVYGLLGGGTP
jgi:hypothetical protein